MAPAPLARTRWRRCPLVSTFRIWSMLLQGSRALEKQTRRDTIRPTRHQPTLPRETRGWPRHAGLAHSTDAVRRGSVAALRPSHHHAEVGAASDRSGAGLRPVRVGDTGRARPGLHALRHAMDRRRAPHDAAERPALHLAPVGRVVGRPSGSWRGPCSSTASWSATRRSTPSDFPVLRTFETGSWLGLAHQGRGIGKEMRAAVLHFGFAGLGGLRAETAAYHDNHSSLGVTRSLGYQDDGTEIKVRRGRRDHHLRFKMERADWEPHPSATTSRSPASPTGPWPCSAWTPTSSRSPPHRPDEPISPCRDARRRGIICGGRIDIGSATSSRRPPRENPCSDSPDSTPPSSTWRRRRRPCTCRACSSSTRRPHPTRSPSRSCAASTPAALAPGAAVPPPPGRDPLRPQPPGVDRRPRLRPRLAPAPHRGAQAGHHGRARGARRPPDRHAPRPLAPPVGGLAHRRSRGRLRRRAVEGAPRRHRRGVGRGAHGGAARPHPRDRRQARRGRAVEARQGSHRHRAGRPRAGLAGPHTGSCREDGASHDRGRPAHPRREPQARCHATAGSPFSAPSTSFNLALTAHRSHRHRHAVAPRREVGEERFRREGQRCRARAVRRHASELPRQARRASRRTARRHGADLGSQRRAQGLDGQPGLVGACQPGDRHRRSRRSAAGDPRRA